MAILLPSIWLLKFSIELVASRIVVPKTVFARIPKAPIEAIKLPEIASARGCKTLATNAPTCCPKLATVADNFSNDSEVVSALVSMSLNFSVPSSATAFAKA